MDRRTPRERARVLEKTMKCTCDLDNSEPEKSTDHSWVCQIHRAAIDTHRFVPKDEADG